MEDTDVVAIIDDDLVDVTVGDTELVLLLETLDDAVSDRDTDELADIVGDPVDNADAVVLLVDDVVTEPDTEAVAEAVGDGVNRAVTVDVLVSDSDVVVLAVVVIVEL